MPSRSKKQHNLMAGVAHGMKPRSGHGPSVEVAKEFVAADKGKKFDAQSPAPYYGGAARGSYDGCGPAHDGSCLCGQIKR